MAGVIGQAEHDSHVGSRRATDRDDPRRVEVILAGMRT
jgi:hypothetical protein